MQLLLSIYRITHFHLLLLYICQILLSQFKFHHKYFDEYLNIKSESQKIFILQLVNKIILYKKGDFLRIHFS